MTEAPSRWRSTVPGQRCCCRSTPSRWRASQAEELRRWGADPALGHSLIEGLSDAFQVVAFDYEGHVLAVPKPDSLTPANVAGDLLAVADAAGADRFAYYGYLAGAGRAAARDPHRPAVGAGHGRVPTTRTGRTQMLQVTTATHELASSPRDTATTWQPSEEPSDELDWSQVEVSLTEPQTRQFVTLYQALQDFDDRAAQAQIRCPRLCFVGAADETLTASVGGGVQVSLAEPIIDRRADLEALRLAGACARRAGPHPGHAGRPGPADPAPLAQRCWACRTLTATMSDRRQARGWRRW